MDWADRFEVVVESADFWHGAVGALVGLACLLALRAASAAVALAIGLGVGATLLSGRLALGVLLLAVAALSIASLARSTERSARPVVGVLLSASAAAATYTCVPDTELALVLLGAAGTAGGGSLLLSWRWDRAATLVTAWLLVIAVTDATPRTSAVIGTVAIAAIHALSQLNARRSGPIELGAAAAAALAMFVCARVAGLRAGIAEPLAIVATAVAAVAWLEVVLLKRRKTQAPV